MAKKKSHLLMASYTDSSSSSSSSSSDNNNNKEYRQYHPYQDLNVPIHNLYNLSTSPEYLFHEEAARQRRSWGENLQYFTGSGFLSGVIIGAAKGSVQGIKAAEPGDTMKLRINRVLNSGGQKGMKFGCSLGTVGLIFSVLESGIINLKGSDDLLNSVATGLGTGVLYRAASGARSAAVAGAIGGLVAGIAVAGKKVIKRYVPI